MTGKASNGGFVLRPPNGHEGNTTGSAKAHISCFLQSDEKLSYLDIHPVKPWVVFADQVDTVVLFDYELQTVLHEWSVQALCHGQSAATGAAHTATTAVPSPGPTHRKRGHTRSVSGDFGHISKGANKIGAVKAVRFYDDEVRHWTAKASLPNVDPFTPAGHGNENSVPVQPRPQQIVIATEYKVLFLDYVSFVTKELSYASVELKSVQSLEFAYTEPCVILGCSDGVIRGWNTDSWKLTKRLVGGHQSAVTQVRMIERGTKPPQPTVISASSDGSLALWTWDSEVMAWHFPKAHHGAILSLTYHPISGQLVTTGADKVIGLWDVRNQRESAKIRPSNKTVFTNVNLHNSFRFPSSAVLTCAKDSHIWVVNSDDDGPPAKLIDLNHDLLSTAGKKFKIYHFVTHPLGCNTIAVGTNLGLIMLTIPHGNVPSVGRALTHPLKLSIPKNSEDPAGCFLPENEKPSIRLYYTGSYKRATDSVNTLVYTRDRSDVAKSQTQREQVLMLSKKGFARIHVSPSGEYLVVHWPDLSEFYIYAVANWQVIDRGQATQLVWSGDSKHLAFLQPRAAPPVDPKASKKGAPAPRVVPKPIVVVKSFVSGESRLEDRQTPVSGEEAVALTGGCLLGVGSADESKIGTMHQFYDWESGAAIGSPIPSPLSATWDLNNQHYCALVYPTSITILSTQFKDKDSGLQTVKSLTTISARAQSVMWYNGALVYSTPTSILLTFPLPTPVTIALATQHLDSPAQAESRLLQVHATHAMISTSNPTTVQDSLCPLPVRRAPGPLALGGVIDDDIVCVSQTMSVFDHNDNSTSFVPLTHTGLKTQLFISAGLPNEALKWSERLHPSLHDKLAIFFDGYGYHEHAFKLSGITPTTLIDLYMKHSMYEEAYTKLKSLADSLPCDATGQGNGDDDLMGAAPVVVDSPEARLVADRLIRIAGELFDPSVDNAPVLTAAESQLVQNALSTAVSIHERHHRHLVLFYAKTGMQDSLESLRSQLQAAGHTAASRFAACFIQPSPMQDHDPVLHAFEYEGDLAKAGFLAGKIHGSESSEMAAVLEEWNASLRAEEVLQGVQHVQIMPPTTST